MSTTEYLPESAFPDRDDLRHKLQAGEVERWRVHPRTGEMWYRIGPPQQPKQQHTILSRIKTLFSWS